MAKAGRSRSPNAKPVKRSSSSKPPQRPRRPMPPDERHADWTARHDEFREHQSSRVALDLLLEILLMTIADLNSKLDGIASGVDTLKAEIAALKNQPPAVATQADLDALGARLDTIQSAITA